MKTNGIRVNGSPGHVRKRKQMVDPVKNCEKNEETLQKA
jgi:hypothetical protein